ncbi:hypothetical protein U1Q18_026858 [Sarracenia purpurea var. burkii]
MGDEVDDDVDNSTMALEAHDEGSENESSKPLMFYTVKPRPFVEAPMAYNAIQLCKVAFRLHLGSPWEVYSQSAIFGAEEVTRTVHSPRKADQEFPPIFSAELQLGSSWELDSRSAAKLQLSFPRGLDSRPAAELYLGSPSEVYS